MKMNVFTLMGRLPALLGRAMVVAGLLDVARRRRRRRHPRHPKD
jgi:hypothetical protein